MTLTEMRELLNKRDIQLTKSLGQNFLHDGNQLRRIVNAAGLQATDKVLEIGPGLGPLTELLVAEAGTVLAIEMDGRLVDFLEERFAEELRGAPSAEGINQSLTGKDMPALTPALSPGERGNGPPVHTKVTGGDEGTAGKSARLTLLHEDALAYLRRAPQDWQDWKLVANLPYSVASPILVELALSPRRPRRMVTTLQLEVAQRLMAKADDEDYGILTLLVQLDFEPREWFKIPAGCFFPAPDVDSACVVLERRAQAFLNESQRRTFVRIVKRAFSQRRKMMLKLLKQEWPAEALTAAFAQLNISPMERAEKLGLEQFTELTKLLQPE